MNVLESGEVSLGEEGSRNGRDRWQGHARDDSVFELQLFA